MKSASLRQAFHGICFLSRHRYDEEGDYNKKNRRLMRGTKLSIAITCEQSSSVLLCFSASRQTGSFSFDSVCAQSSRNTPTCMKFLDCLSVFCEKGRREGWTNEVVNERGNTRDSQSINYSSEL